MTEPKQVGKMMPEMPGLGIKLADIYYIIFRQKWLILGFLAAGLVTAAIVYFSQKPLYWSEAKLLVRYVVDTKSMETVMGAQVQSANVGGETVINSELEILTSMDLCEDVASRVGPEKILGAGKGSNVISAAVAVYNGLSVENPRRSNIIKVRFVHADPVICRAVLQQLIDSYFTHHKLVHSRSGADDDILMQQSLALVARIRSNEEKLHGLRAQAGVISVEDAKKNLSEEMSRLKQDVFNVEAQLEEFRTLWGILPSPSKEEKEPAMDRIPPEKVAEYKALTIRLDALRSREFDLLSQYTDENPLVKRVREQIADSENRKKTLEEENPKLATLHVPQPAGVSAVDARPDPVRVAALESKLRYLTNQLALVRSDITLLDNLDMQILEVNRVLEIDRKNYMLIMGSLEAARVNEALSNRKMSNIQPVQSPSPPALNISKRLKTVAGAFIGLLVAGIAGAFLIELFVDHSVRRPSQFESKVQLPLFISIPRMELNGHSQMLPLPAHLGGSDAAASSPPTAELKKTWVADHPLRPYIDGLRDRTLIHFEGDPHKPKLIGITSCSEGVGVTSLAAGLAGALSETGDGNVLLLNLNFESQSVHPFYRGELTCGLADVLEADKLRNNAVMQNLYVATAGSATETEPQNLSKQLARVVPKLRVSDYDYIVFDLPATTPTTMTARLAGMMDLVILVVESGKDTQETVKQAAKQLSRSKARISAVLNKVKNPVPQWLHKGA